MLIRLCGCAQSTATLLGQQPLCMYGNWLASLTAEVGKLVLPLCCMSRPASFVFFITCHKSGGVLCYTLRTVLSVRPSFQPLSTFWPIFFKLCIDIGEEWFGIANGQNWFINNRVMALECVFPQYLQNWYWGGVVWDCKWAKLVYKQQTYGPWMCFSSVSSEQMDEFG